MPAFGIPYGLLLYYTCTLPSALIVAHALVIVNANMFAYHTPPPPSQTHSAPSPPDSTPSRLYPHTTRTCSTQCRPMSVTPSCIRCLHRISIRHFALRLRAPDAPDRRIVIRTSTPPNVVSSKTNVSTTLSPSPTPFVAPIVGVEVLATDTLIPKYIRLSSGSGSWNARELEREWEWEWGDGWTG